MTGGGAGMIKKEGENDNPTPSCHPDEGQDLIKKHYKNLPFKGRKASFGLRRGVNGKYLFN